MKILFIGGTGNISLSTSKRLIEQGHELWIANRTGHHNELPLAQFIQIDIHEDVTPLQNHQWDVVVNWIAFTPKDVERDIALFRGETQQYVFISSASCYQNPGPTPWITEKTPLQNPYWQYSRDKIKAEQLLMAAFHKHEFPVTIVRPSHTYSTVFPLTIGGWHEYTAVARMKAGKPVVVQGDGTSLWTLTHAEDFAKGFVGLLGLRQAVGEDFHITSDEFLSWNQIYQLTAEAAGCEASIVHVASDKICQLDTSYTGSLLGDKANSALFDNSKIKRFVPDFKATIPYAEGIKRTLAWFDQADNRRLIDPQTDALIEHLVQLG